MQGDPPMVIVLRFRSPRIVQRWTSPVGASRLIFSCGITSPVDRILMPSTVNSYSLGSILKQSCSEQQDRGYQSCADAAEHHAAKTKKTPTLFIRSAPHLGLRPIPRRMLTCRIGRLASL